MINLKEVILAVNRLARAIEHATEVYEKQSVVVEGSKREEKMVCNVCKYDVNNPTNNKTG